MKHLTLTIRGEQYSIDEHGCIYDGPNNVVPGCKDGHQWDFIGVSKHWKNNRPTVSFQDIWELPGLADGGYLWDIDHGTVRQWGGRYYGKSVRVQHCYMSD